MYNLGIGRFSITELARLQRGLSDQGFSIDDLGSAEALEQLSRRMNGLQALAVGTLQSRTGGLVNMQCKLLRTDSDEPAAIVGGTALLSANDWAMIGRSAATEPDDYRPHFPVTSSSGQQLPDQFIRRLDDRSEGPHPMLNPKFPFRVRLMIGGKERKGFFQGNDYIVPVNPGEVYELEIESRNQGPDLALMRLLVDGLNTLPEPVTKGLQTNVSAQPVSLDEARTWKLIRGEGLRKGPGEIYTVKGFYKLIDGPNSPCETFRVVDAADSWAGQQKFTEQMGLITAAFYAARRARGVGTGSGGERYDDVRTVADVPIGNLLGVIHIKYVDSLRVAPDGTPCRCCSKKTGRPRTPMRSNGLPRGQVVERNRR